MRRRSDSTTMLAGWLFADLILAFAVIVLGSDAGDPVRAEAASRASTTTTTVARRPQPTTTVVPRGLSTKPLCLFAKVSASTSADEVAGRFRYSPDASRLSGGRAGLVFVWQISNPTTDRRLAKKVIDEDALTKFEKAVFGPRSGFSPVQARPLWSAGWEGDEEKEQICPFPPGVQANVVAEVYLLN